MFKCSKPFNPFILFKVFTLVHRVQLRSIVKHIYLPHFSLLRKTSK